MTLRTVSILVTAVLGIALMAGPAEAGKAVGEKVEDVRSLLLFGPGSGNGDGAIAAGYARERIHRKQRPDERVGVSGIPFPTDAPYWLTGDGVAASCPEGGAVHGNLAHVVDRTRRAMDVLESDKVIEIVDDFEKNAPCLVETAEAELLAQLYLLRGLAFHVEGELDLAQADFARAAGIFPELSWDVGYPPDPQQTYLLAREDIGKTETVTFGYSFSMARPVTVTVNGAPIDPFSTVELPPVPLLVQIKDGGKVTSMLINTPEGGNTILLDRMGASAAVMGGPDSELSRVASRTILDAVAAQWNVEQVVVVNTLYRKTEREPLVYRYDVATRGFEPLTAIKTVRVPAPPHADKMRIAVGGALQLEAGATDLAQSTHGALRPGGDIEFRIGHSLTPGGGVDLVMHRIKDADGSNAHWVLTPQLRGSLGARIRPRFVHPYLGVTILVRFDQNLDRGVVFGAAIAGNFDIVSPRLPGWFLRVGGSVGSIDQDGFVEAGAKVGISL